MNHIVSDCMTLGRGIAGLIQSAAKKEHLHTLVQVSRPNWPASAHARATRYLREQGLRRSTEFNCVDEFLSYLDKQLNAFSRQHPVRAEVVVADDLTLARWEARWRRVRQRVPNTSVSQATATLVSQAA